VRALAKKEARPIQKNVIINCLRRWSENAFEAFLDSLKDLTDQQAWWCVPLGSTEEYLHSSGSILGITLHVASCKIMYAEYAFGEGKLTWRDMSRRARQAEPHLQKAIGWLREAQGSWLRSWETLSDKELTVLRKTNWGEDWTTEKIITEMLHHDIHHAGQIWLIRAQLPKDLSSVKPISEADLWDRYLSS
jgi:uncharacterized damage-inducible protein DinB